MNLSRSIFLISMFSLPIATASAETIYFKDGGQVRGTIMTVDETNVSIVTKNGPLTINKSDIKHIDYLDLTDDTNRPFGGHYSNGVVNLTLGQKLANKEVEAGPYLEANVFKAIDPMISVGAGLGYSRVETKDETMTKGDITMIPLLVKIRLQSQPGPTVIAAEAGIGHYFFHHTINNTDREIFLRDLGVETKEQVGNVLGGYLGLSLNFISRSDAYFGLNLQQHVIRPDLTASARNVNTGQSVQITKTLNLNSLILSANLACRY